jgi:CheY-like chemotaxis protein
MRIVCVDDDPIFVAVMYDYLRELGHSDVQTYNDPLVVARMAAQGTVGADVFLLDLEMPGMTGAELCAALRASPMHRTTPIIMVSSVKERERVRGALATGASDFLNKPLDQLELRARLTMVERILTERRRNVALEAEIDDLRDEPEFTFGFQDAVLPNAEDGVVDILFLENEMMSLGWSALPGTSVICLRLQNAAWAYTNLDRVDYVDFLSEAAEMILSALPAARYRLAYAGAGDFLAVLDRQSRPDPIELQLALDRAEGMMWESYRMLGIPAPEISAGMPVVAPLLGAAPRRMMLQARERVVNLAATLPRRMPSGAMAAGQNRLASVRA